MRTVLPALAMAVLTLVFGVIGLANPSTTPAASAKPEGANIDAVIDSVINRNPGLFSYSAHTTWDIRQKNFPYLHPVLEGSEYFTSPGFTLFDFPHTPAYLKGITKVESTAYAANRWRRCYDISLQDQPNAYLLHMVPKIRGEVTSVDVTVSKTDAQLQHFDWSYNNPDDHVSLTQTYSTIGGYSVVTQQQSELRLHHIRAVGTSQFYGFQYNQPVPTPTPTPSDPLHQCDN